MKKYLQSLITLCSLALLGMTGTAQVHMYPEIVTMGPGYANEIYYQFSTGNTASATRDTWDISFRTKIMSSSILINDGSGAILWTYPYADTSGWATVDTFGLSSWPPMYNDPTDWENGAFSRHTTEHPDYGWGIYNMATHVIVGDSLFIIQNDLSLNKFLKR